MSAYQGDNELEARLQRIEGSVTELQRSNDDLTGALAITNENIDNITTTVNDTVTQTGQQNLIRNGNVDHSRNTYLYDTDFTGSGGVDADVSEEAAFIYTHPKGATQLFEDTTDVDADSTPSTNTTLKTSAHSRYSSTISNPSWDKVNGWAAAGVSNTLDFPLPDKLIKASKSYYVGFLARLVTIAENGSIASASKNFSASALNADPSDVGRKIVVHGAGDGGADLVTTVASVTDQNNIVLADAALTTVSGATAEFEPMWNPSLQPVLNIGLWDNSPGQYKYIIGDQLSLAAKTVNNSGSSISTVSTEYFVVAISSWGQMIGSQKVTIDAPVNGSYSRDVYVDFYWKSFIGALNYLLYKKVGGLVYLVKEVYPSNSFKDVSGEYIRQEPSGYPASLDSPTAFINSTAQNFNPTARWQRFTFAVPVPDSYNVANTTDRQWLRIGLNSTLVGCGMIKALQLDEITIDDKNGIFTYNPLDFGAKRSAPISPAGGSQGTATPPVGGGYGVGDAGGNDGTGTIGSGGVYIPPGDGGFCPTFDTMIRIKCPGDAGIVAVRAIDLIDNEESYKVINRAGIPSKYVAHIGSPRVIYRLKTDGGKIVEASEKQPVFSDYTDVIGKPLSDIKIGDKVLTKDGIETVIVCRRLVKKRHVVKISLFNRNHGYWANDFGFSNLKPLDYELPSSIF